MQLEKSYNSAEDELSEDQKRLNMLLKFFDKVKTIHGQNIIALINGCLTGKITEEGYLTFKREFGRDFAEFEFYKIFEQTYHELEKRMDWKAPEISIIAGPEEELETNLENNLERL